MALPTPRSIRRNQRKQYRKLLEKQAEPYEVRSEKVAKKMDDLWDQTKAFKIQIENYEKADSQLQGLLAQELKRISSAEAPYFKRSKISSIISSREKRPSGRELHAARKELKQNPFDTKRIKELKDLEQRSGSDVMVAYLDKRLTEIQKGGR